MNAGEILGWVCWTVIAIPGAILIWAGVVDAIVAWRAKEITKSQLLGIAPNAIQKRPVG